MITIGSAVSHRITFLLHNFQFLFNLLLLLTRRRVRYINCLEIENMNIDFENELRKEKCINMNIADLIAGSRYVRFTT